MTEIPEHLLARSKARRAVLAGGDAGDTAVPAVVDAPAASGAADTTAATAAATSAPTQAAAPPPKVPTYVRAANERKRAPFWAVSLMAVLPLWGMFYFLTLDPPTPRESSPLAMGAEIYSSKGCAGCHGATGSGGVGPGFTNGKILATFPNPGDHLKWTFLGSDGWKKAVGTTRGATNAPVLGGMPPQGAALTPEELLHVVRHERETLGGATFADESELWATAAEALNDTEGIDAATVEEYKTAIDEMIAAGK